MATSTRVRTIQDLNPEITAVRLQLEREADELAANRPDLPGYLERLKNYAKSWFKIAQTELDLDPEPTLVATEKNKKKIDTAFDSIIKQMNEQRKEVKKEMENMTPKQQESIVIFWEGVSQFFNGVLIWIKDLFSTVIDAIRKGFELMKDAVKEFFDTVLALFKKLCK